MLMHLCHCPCEARVMGGGVNAYASGHCPCEALVMGGGVNAYMYASVTLPLCSLRRMSVGPLKRVGV